MKKKKKRKLKNCQVPKEPTRMGNPRTGRIEMNAPRNFPISGNSI